MNISQYIQSGIVEAYALGLATPVEKQEFESLLPLSPALQEALSTFEHQLELLATDHAIPPPADTRRQFHDFLEGMPIQKHGFRERANGNNGNGKGTTYITAKEVSSDQIKVHKYWRIAFLVVFILSKIFLAFLIYYALRYHQSQLELKQLQHQLQQQQSK